MHSVSRRGFLAASGAALGGLPLLGATTRPASALDVVRGFGAPSTAQPPFLHGVASGDPLSDRVVLWTRVTPAGAAQAERGADVSWELARDPGFTRVVNRGETRTGAARDFTVKLDVSGLEAGTTYFYRFVCDGVRSPVGRTRTLPERGVERVRLGVVSCSNYAFGYFNAYACLARRTDLDAVVHLGDYLYEGAGAPRGGGGRTPLPERVTVTLEDYRERHAQYKEDPDSQEAHRQHPFIVVWDDHEFADNAWSGGAMGHRPARGEGEWEPRRAAALQAYFEWMPIRDDRRPLSPTIYRTFRFGGLAELIMLDTRLAGRDPQVWTDDIYGLEEAGRSVLGDAQERWLAAELTESVRAGTPWQVLGQQVMFAPQVPPGGWCANSDSWDGYRASRDRVFDMVEQARTRNFAILSGDMHSAWAYDLPRRPFESYDPASGRGSVGIELVGTSVTSPNSLGRGPDGERELAYLRSERPHLHYVDGRYRGYYVLDLTRERLQADYFAMDSVTERGTGESFVKGFVTPSGQNHLVEVEAPAGVGVGADREAAP